ncbi:MAG: hypothetical protein PCFJNLEI_01237 [Verrucomicrobiae bacterium]|nr:hypothetical protein [Verrucomicrobiae bacterium]
MKKPSKFERTQEELTKSLHALRVVAKEIGQNYIAGLQAEVARLETAVRQAKEDDMPDRKQLQQMTSMLRWLNDLDVKPQKGRRRDVKLLDKLIVKLSKVVENW